MKASICVPITETTQVGEARRLVAALTFEMSLSETLRGQAAIIVTELANNLVKHTQGRGGELVFRSVESAHGPGIDILSLDKGPGMTDVGLCMEDGYSTAGSSGTGLGAIQRLSSVFDIYSAPQTGTVILSQVITKPAHGLKKSSELLEVGAICLPIRGETVSGDLWTSKLQPDSCSFIVADGLGHGPLAFEASHAAIKCFEVNSMLSPSEGIKAVHLALKNTRGAAVSIAQIEIASQRVAYAGVGNIAGMVFSRSGEQRRMVSHNGTAGLQTRTVQEFNYPWESGAILVMHSDGLTSQWSIDSYRGLLSHHPSVIAGVLYRDFSRGRDDVSVLVASAWVKE